MSYHGSNSSKTSTLDSRSSTSSTAPVTGKKAICCTFTKEHAQKVEEEIQLPDFYQPDTRDKVRIDGLLKGLDPNCFHALHSTTQERARIVAALVKRGDDEQRAVAKIYDLVNCLPKTIRRLRREHQLHRVLRHKNIVPFVEAMWRKDSEGKPRQFIIVTQRVDCSLAHHFRSLSQKDVFRQHPLMGAMLVQILSALSFLNRIGILHRDLTSKNIGVNLNGFEIKLLNFGAERERDSSGLQKLRINAAPETIARKGYDCKVDIWAAALIAVEMLGCFLMKPSEETMTLEALRRRIVEVCGLPENRYATFYAENGGENIFANDEVQDGKLQELIPWDCLTKGMATLNNANFLDLIRSMLSVDPTQRPSAEACLRFPYLCAMNERYTRAEIHRTQPMDERENFIREVKEMCKELK